MIWYLVCTVCCPVGTAVTLLECIMLGAIATVLGPACLAEVWLVASCVGVVLTFVWFLSVARNVVRSECAAVNATEVALR